MLQFLIGLALSLYSVFVIKTLVDWRTNVLKFVEEVLKSGKDLVEEGKQLLNPVRDAADSTRKSAEKIDSIAGNLKRDLPPKLKEVSQNIKNANEAIIKLQPEISSAIRELPINIVGILDEVIQFLESRSPDLKSLSEDVNQVRLVIDDPNAANEKDIVAIINRIAKKLHETGNSDSFSETLKDTGGKLDKAAEFLGVLAFVIVGDAAPLTLSVLTALSAVLIIKDITDALTIKKGSLLSIKLRYPTSDIDITIKTPPGFEDIDVDLVSAGGLIDTQLEVPDRDISLFPLPRKVSEFLNKVEDARQKAQQAIDAPAIAKNVTEAFNAVGEGLKNTGGIVETASNTLLETNEVIGKVVPTLDSFSGKLSTFSEEFTEKAAKLKPFGKNIADQSEKLQKAIDQNFPTLTKSLDTIITEIETLDISTPLGVVQDTAVEIKKIADLIDDGTDLNSLGKKDFLQRINNILKVLMKLLQTGKSFDKLFKPLYLIVVALHTLLLVTGLVLIVLFLASLRSSAL